MSQIPAYERSIQTLHGRQVVTSYSGGYQQLDKMYPFRIICLRVRLTIRARKAPLDKATKKPPTNSQNLAQFLIDSMKWQDLNDDNQATDFQMRGMDGLSQPSW